MRILLTGATGFVGRHLIEALGEDQELVALGRRPARSAAREVEWIEQDLAGPLRRERLPERVDAIVHLAQSSRYRDFPGGAEDVFAVNVRATFDLLEYARTAGAERFVLASTGGLYEHSYERLVETAPLEPLNFYLTSKHVAELLLGNYKSLFVTVVFRFFFVYGPGQGPMLIPTLLGTLRRGETVRVDGNPGLRINPIHVRDAVRVFEPALALERSDVFNVAGDEVVSITDLVRLLGEAHGLAADVRHGPSVHAGDLVGDNERMKAVLGVRPQVSLAEGLAALD